MTHSYKTYDDAPLPDLWEYSLLVYESGDVARLCLALQDTFVLDVNMLLYCLWGGRQGYQLTTLAISTIAKAPHAWQKNTVIPLRQLRIAKKSQLKTTPLSQWENINRQYQSLKHQELNAERKEQDFILKAHHNQLLDGLICPQNQDYGLYNLKTYCHHFSVVSDTTERDALLQSLYNQSHIVNQI